MKAYAPRALVVLWLGLLCCTAFAAMQDGVRLEADGEIIDSLHRRNGKQH